ncbi:hypothetical protein NMY22_g1753 [Coprinellus aureogranulatus]|nr:hypothetical protein NMY22_g1753 [Coprinellus aureogranulatus]
MSQPTHTMDSPPTKGFIARVLPLTQGNVHLLPSSTSAKRVKNFLKNKIKEKRPKDSLEPSATRSVPTTPALGCHSGSSNPALGRPYESDSDDDDPELTSVLRLSAEQQRFEVLCRYVLSFQALRIADVTRNCVSSDNPVPLPDITSEEDRVLEEEQKAAFEAEQRRVQALFKAARTRVLNLNEHYVRNRQYSESDTLIANAICVFHTDFHSWYNAPRAEWRTQQPAKACMSHRCPNLRMATGSMEEDGSLTVVEGRLMEDSDVLRHAPSTP